MCPSLQTRLKSEMLLGAEVMGRWEAEAQAEGKGKPRGVFLIRKLTGDIRILGQKEPY